jgi:two-component system, cell cycle sensor histidine kinase and response regulator CckA
VKEFLGSIFNAPTDTILIVEPDPLLRRLEDRALSPKYQIVQTSSPEEAVRMAARHEVNLDLLLTEVRFPRINGWDLIELLKLDYPDLKVVYLSSSIDPEIRARIRRSPVVVLDKNRFHPARLRQAVRDVLEPHRTTKTTLKGTADGYVSLFRRVWEKLHVGFWSGRTSGV